MISKSTIKLIKSLAVKKYRLKEKLFLVEGDKIITEVLNSGLTVEKLFTTDSYSSENEKSCKHAISHSNVQYSDIKKASLLNHPQNSIALCRMPEKITFPTKLGNNLSIYLDDIQDPGNLGTIIRLCDWFQIEYLFCSPNTVDMFNPKVIQASMGSFSRVSVLKTDFEPVSKLALSNTTPVFGAFLEGENIYETNLPQKAILVMGNEGKGIQKELQIHVNQKINIPDFSTNKYKAESLNVSVATAIIFSEFKRPGKI